MSLLLLSKQVPQTFLSSLSKLNKCRKHFHLLYLSSSLMAFIPVTRIYYSMFPLNLKHSSQTAPINPLTLLCHLYFLSFSEPLKATSEHVIYRYLLTFVRVLEALDLYTLSSSKQPPQNDVLGFSARAIVLESILPFIDVSLSLKYPAFLSVKLAKLILTMWLYLTLTELDSDRVYRL